MTTTPPHQTPGAWPVYGHQWASQYLQRALQPGGDAGRSARLSHAYLFLGPPQVGKTTFARAFATALLCSSATAAPCYTCRACRLMALESHPDFRMLQPTAKVDKEFIVDRQKGELRADQAEQLIRDVALRPMEGRRKVFLIQDMQLANPAFANKILKTLEEPPPHAVLLVTAHHRAALLPTIVSRCQVIELRSLDQAVVKEALQQGWQAAADEAELLARLSAGRLGWAVDQLRHPERSEERNRQLASLWRLMSADRVERLNFASELAAQRDPQSLFGLLEVWTSWWRDVLLAQAGCQDACSNIDQQERIAHHAGRIEGRAVQGYLATLTRIEGYLRHTVNVRLALDVLLLKLPAANAL
ncbi:MAG: AAA family ATPase [Caldilineaceae bacterium]|jgi:DNA polymerase-3 subunit delta'|nr:AAA family ATPase [Caldilineaceae bacterium]